VVAPPSEDEYYSEKILRVDSSYLTFEVSYPVPDVAPPPFLQNGYIAFGCFAPLYKITPPVIAAWSEILKTAPETKLFLKNTAFDSQSNCNHVLNRFAEHDIPQSRLILSGSANHLDFLRAYDEIDIALDTFPYNGGTTTTEALWQGVPVITFYGDRWASRTSASILHAGNLNQFVATDLEGYVELATSIDPMTLGEIRRSMRDRLQASPVCGADAFTTQMEEIYRTISRD
jgi:predicted O-linked N-acetylglucosamine transferase (SPINDLY family)